MNSVFDDELQHHGIKGQRWGVRRFQNEDGSLTPAGERRYNNNGSGAAKPNGARNPTYTLNSGKAYRRGKGLGTGPVGSRGEGFVGGGGGHSYGSTGGGGSSSGTQGAGRDPEPQPIGSDEWWKWYENTDNRELAEKHYNMVIARDSRDKKRNRRNNIHADTAHEYAKDRNASQEARARDHQQQMMKETVSEGNQTLQKAINAGKSFLSKLASSLKKP